MDRYLVRMNESLESVKTLNKCIRTLTTWYLSYTEVYGHVLTNMESMIHYFKLVTEGYTFTLGQTYLRQESPKGELGCYIVHGQTTHPCRVSIRTPDYTNLQAVHVLSTDHYVADLIATLGTADIVLGSVDKIGLKCNLRYRHFISNSHHHRFYNYPTGEIFKADTYLTPTPVD